MKNQSEDIRLIREMMEKSSKFLSLSGFSGIVNGLLAISGVLVAYFFVLKDLSSYKVMNGREMSILIAVALLVLCLSILSSVIFSSRKARKKSQKPTKSIVIQTIYNLGIPLVTGGVIALFFIFKGNISALFPTTLIFYGLALINASKYTYKEIHYLGILEIILGLLALFFPVAGLWLWGAGFGVCHIIYGLTMYIKYDLNKHE